MIFSSNIQFWGEKCTSIDTQHLFICCSFESKLLVIYYHIFRQKVLNEMVSSKAFN